MSQLPSDPVQVAHGDEVSFINGESDDGVSQASLVTKGAASRDCPPTGTSSDKLFFHQGRLDFALVRNLCARAVSAYNNEYVEAPMARRAELWQNIVDPARVRLSLPGEHPALTFKEAGANSQKTPLQVAQRALLPTIKPDIFIEYGLRVRIDPEAFINKGCVILDSPVADVTIGAGTSLGPRVSIYSVNHSLAQDANGKRSTFGEPVTIGDGCWIGGGTTIMPGVTIGAHSTIGADSLVTEPIPAGVLAYGRPAKVVRSLDTVTDGPPPAYACASTMSLSDALHLGVDETRHDRIRLEVEFFEKMGEKPPHL